MLIKFLPAEVKKIDKAIANLSANSQNKCNFLRELVDYDRAIGGCS